MIPDWAHLQTDKEIEALKQAYADTFRQALEEMQAYQAESMSGYEWDREWLEEQLERADISPEKYKAWCEERALNQAWRADLIDRLSIDAVRAEQECSAMLRDRGPGQPGPHLRDIRPADRRPPGGRATRPSSRAEG
jgi:hypothetical protein